MSLKANLQLLGGVSASTSPATRPQNANETSAATSPWRTARAAPRPRRGTSSSMPGDGPSQLHRREVVAHLAGLVADEAGDAQTQASIVCGAPTFQRIIVLGSRVFQHANRPVHRMRKRPRTASGHMCGKNGRFTKGARTVQSERANDSQASRMAQTCVLPDKRKAQDTIERGPLPKQHEIMDG